MGGPLFYATGDTNVLLEDGQPPTTEELIERRQHVRSVAQEHMRAARDVWTRWYDEVVARGPRKDFKVGDPVMRLLRRGAAEGVSGALAKKWDGPWRVVEVRGPSSYKLKEVHGDRDYMAHANDIKAFKPPVEVEVMWPDDAPQPRNRHVENDVEAEVDDPAAMQRLFDESPPPLEEERADESEREEMSPPRDDILSAPPSEEEKESEGAEPPPLRKKIPRRRAQYPSTRQTRSARSATEHQSDSSS